ncbi:MAG: hypothetical protein ACHQRO_14790, partial [Vicinamibacteria bacterium]
GGEGSARTSGSRGAASPRGYTAPDASSGTASSSSGGGGGSSSSGGSSAASSGGGDSGRTAVPK